MSPRKAPPEEEITGGLIDRLLALRSMPEPGIILAGEVAVKAWQGAVDRCLDALVPALKKVSLAEAVANHGVNCVFKPEIEEVIGRVPLRKTAKGWE